MTQESLTEEKVVNNSTDKIENENEVESINENIEVNNIDEKSIDIDLKDFTKDYLDPSLMTGIRIVESSEIEEGNDQSNSISEEEMSKYIGTFSDIAQNQIITGRVIGQNEKEIIMDIGFRLHKYGWEKLYKNSKYTHYKGGRTHIMYKVKKK